MPARRKDQNLRSAARALTAEALKTLAEIARTGASEHARIAAATAILDRGHGKPGQGLRLGGEEGAPIQHLVRWALTPSEATPDPCLTKEPPPTS